MDEIYTVFGVTDAEFLRCTGSDAGELVLGAVQSMYSLSKRGALVARELVYRATMEVVVYDAVLDGGRLQGLEQYITLIYVNSTAHQACMEAGLALTEVAHVTMEQIAPNSGVVVRLPVYFTR